MVVTHRVRLSKCGAIFTYLKHFIFIQFTLAKSSAIMPTTATRDSNHCSWAAQQKIGLFLFFVASPKVAKARTYSVAVVNIFAKITSPMSNTDGPNKLVSVPG